MSNGDDLVKKIWGEHEAAVQKELARRVEAQKKANEAERPHIQMGKTFAELKADVAKREAELAEIRRELNARDEVSSGYAMRQVEEREAARISPIREAYEDRVRESLADFNEAYRAEAVQQEVARRAWTKRLLRSAMVVNLVCMAAGLVEGFRLDSEALCALAGCGLGAGIIIMICFWGEP